MLRVIMRIATHQLGSRGRADSSFPRPSSLRSCRRDAGDNGLGSRLRNRSCAAYNVTRDYKAARKLLGLDAILDFQTGSSP